MTNKVINQDAAKAFRQRKLSIRKKLNQMKKDGLITGREFISRINQLSQVKLGGTFPASLTAATKTTKPSTTKAAAGNKTVNIATPTTRPKPKQNQNFRAENKPKAAPADWKNYSSIAAAKKAGSLYYSKNGVKNAAVYAEDLKGKSLQQYMNEKTGKTPRKPAKKSKAQIMANVDTAIKKAIKTNKAKKNG